MTPIVILEYAGVIGACLLILGIVVGTILIGVSTLRTTLAQQKAERIKAMQEVSEGGKKGSVGIRQNDSST